MKGSFRHLGHVDVAGGGQIVVQDDHAFVGHMAPPHGTTILDVSDASHPVVVAEVPVPPHTHSHKVRVHGDVMIVNYEQFGDRHPDFRGGLKVFDISDRTKPTEIAFFACDGRGVHRFDFDGDYAYISPQVEGYVGNIVMILDLRDAVRPVEVSRWWLPGQHIAGGEEPSWEGTRHRCHHPLRLGDRLYTSYWHGGFVIIDISDITSPVMVSHMDWSPPYPCPTHTALPIPHDLEGRRFMIVTDEEVADRLAPSPSAFMWMVDITDESTPVPVSTYRVRNDQPFDPDRWFGAHQPQEQVDGNIIFVTWFAGGLRAVDISDPYALREVGRFDPQPGAGQTIVQSNDVFRDRETGRIYLVDRLTGLDILEFEEPPAAT